MKNNLTTLFLVGVLFTLQTNSYAKDKNREEVNPNSKTDYSYQYLSSIKDTLYTLKSSFLEVNIASQMGYLHLRDSSLYIQSINRN